MNTYLVASSPVPTPNIISNNLINYKVRTATDNDFEYIFLIWLEGIRDSFNTESVGLSTLRRRFKRNFSKRSGIFNFWVSVDENGNIQGWQSLIRASNNPFRAEICAESSTYIAKECRFRGLGKALQKHAIREAEKSNLQYLIGYVSVTNGASRKMLKDIGWIEVGAMPITEQGCDKHRKIIVVRPLKSRKEKE